MANNCNSGLLRSITRRNNHVIANPAASAISKDAPVTVYEGDMYNYAANSWNSLSNIRDGPHASKYKGLIPFWLESLTTRKHYVLKLSVYPQARILKFDVCDLKNGTRPIYLPIDQVIPVTKYDYWGAHRLWAKQNPCLDLDMIYANRTTKEMFVFDKNGMWNDEGVNHEALSMERTYNETNWYDEFSVHNM